MKKLGGNIKHVFLSHDVYIGQIKWMQHAWQATAGSGGTSVVKKSPFGKHQTCFLVIDDCQFGTDCVDLNPVGLFLCVYAVQFPPAQLGVWY